jgi:hypothetical protein
MVQRNASRSNTDNQAVFALIQMWYRLGESNDGLHGGAKGLSTVNKWMNAYWRIERTGTIASASTPVHISMTSKDGFEMNRVPSYEKQKRSATLKV